MATAVASQVNPKRYPGRRYDNRFISVMVALLLAAVVFGFSRTYYLAGVFHAPLPNRLIHVHGAVFSCWLILLIVQTALVSARRVDVHRKLGLAGFGLSCLMVILGVLAATDALSRNFVPPGFPMDAYTFYTVPIGDMLIFAVLIFFAYRLRQNSAAHKRLILIATIGILDAAIARWPIALVQQSHVVADLCNYAFLLPIVLYDLWSTGKIQRVTIWASLFVIIVQQIRVPIGTTSAWHAFAAWAQSLHI
jgi:hypothetical protein